MNVVIWFKQLFQKEKSSRTVLPKEMPAEGLSREDIAQLANRFSKGSNWVYADSYWQGVPEESVEQVTT